MIVSVKPRDIVYSTRHIQRLKGIDKHAIPSKAFTACIYHINSYASTYLAALKHYRRVQRLHHVNHDKIMVLAVRNGYKFNLTLGIGCISVYTCIPADRICCGVDAQTQ